GGRRRAQDPAAPQRGHPPARREAGGRRRDAGRRPGPAARTRPARRAPTPDTRGRPAMRRAVLMASVVLATVLCAALLWKARGAGAIFIASLTIAAALRPAVDRLEAHRIS